MLGEVGDRQVHGSELIDMTSERIKLIRSRLLEVQSRHKSYADRRRKDLEFQVGDKVFLKVSHWKGILIFGRKGKLASRYIGPYEILERVGNVAYRLTLSPELERIHNVFHVSMLKKYVSDLTHILENQPIELNENMTCEEKPMKIVERKVQELRSRQIPLVKVLWTNHHIQYATLELENDMKEKYQDLFED